jgi:hypothetical protein
LTSCQHGHFHASAPFQKIGEVEMALPLLRSEIAGGKKSAEPSVCCAVGWPDGDVGRAIAEGEAAADRVTQACRFCGEMPAHDSGKRIAVGDRKSRKAEFSGRRGKLFRMRGAAEKREIRGYKELCIARPLNCKSRLSLPPDPRHRDLTTIAT